SAVPDVFDRLPRTLATNAERAAAKARVEVDVAELEAVAPVALDAPLLARVEREVARLTPRARRMTSGAIHDAPVLARRVPAALILVPSRGGISHSPHEFTEARHCQLAANVLEEIIVELTR